MAEVTVGQMCELFAQIKSGRATRERLDVFLKESLRNPQERLCLTLLKQAQRILPSVPDVSRQSGLLADLVEVFASLGKLKVAENLASHIIPQDPHYTGSNYNRALDSVIEMFCLRRCFQHARDLVERTQNLAIKARRWIIVAATTKDTHEETYCYALQQFGEIWLKLDLPDKAIAHARSGNLAELRAVQEIAAPNGWSREAVLYTGVIEFLKTGQLSPFCYEIAEMLANPWLQFELYLAIAKVSRSNKDFERCRTLASFLETLSEHHPFHKIAHLAKITAVTGSNSDIERVMELFEHLDFHSDLWLVYEIARALTKTGDTARARSYANECQDPFWKPRILIGIAQVLAEEQKS